jgi:hypothetical protein
MRSASSNTINYNENILNCSKDIVNCSKNKLKYSKDILRPNISHINTERKGIMHVFSCKNYQENLIVILYALLEWIDEFIICYFSHTKNIFFLRMY